jgi:hypothetical protein
MAKIVAAGNKVELQATTSQWCLRRDRKPLYKHCIPTARIPHPFSCTVARVLNRIWLVNEAMPANDGDASITLESNGGRWLCAVRLLAGDELCFDIRYAIAFTKQCRIWTGLELSWGAIAVGKTFVQHAIGPCEIVFELVGRENVDVSDGASFAASRLVAWTPNTITFGVGGIGRSSDVYLNDVLISVEIDAALAGSCVLLVNNEMWHQPSNGSAMVWRFVRDIYWPF